MTCLECEDSNHERCKVCSGCVLCGCLCHLTGSAEESEEEALDLASGLLEPFQGGEDQRCPKCRFTGVKTKYHGHAIKGEVPATACENIVGWTFPQINLGEHLCRRCHGCGYTWAEQTADSA
jgi:hypothetical protein